MTNQIIKKSHQKSEFARLLLKGAQLSDLMSDDDYVVLQIMPVSQEWGYC